MITGLPIVLGVKPVLRNAIKSAGGQAYADLLEYERAARKKFQAAHPEKFRTYRQKHRKDVLSEICSRARKRGRKKGLDATITASDIAWPKRCPVLGLKLDYTPRGQRSSNNPANPTLDRWDNTKGYVPGNVFVISMRANTIKNNATWQELHAVMVYARAGAEAVQRWRLPKTLRRVNLVDEAEAAVA